MHAVSVKGCCTCLAVRQTHGYIIRQYGLIVAKTRTAEALIESMPTTTHIAQSIWQSFFFFIYNCNISQGSSIAVQLTALYLVRSEEAWFSVCPEEIGKHIARRGVGLAKARGGRPLRIMDFCCGAGGNAVQCATMPEIEHVYANDLEEHEVRLFYFKMFFLM